VFGVRRRYVWHLMFAVMIASGLPLYSASSLLLRKRLESFGRLIE
jgi:hypothetical protein